jgi:hypothetical protein
MENDESLVSFLKMHDHDESKELSSFVSITPRAYWQLFIYLSAGRSNVMRENDSTI